MLQIDSEKMIIAMTRDDTAYIVFSATKPDGDPYDPVNGDILRFAVAKKVGAEPLFEIINTMDNDSDAFWLITIGADAWEQAKTKNNGADMKFGDYAFDVQLTTEDGIDTIIGTTDDVQPIFRVWGEVAKE